MTVLNQSKLNTVQEITQLIRIKNKGNSATDHQPIKVMIDYHKRRENKQELFRSLILKP